MHSSTFASASSSSWVASPKRRERVLHGVSNRSGRSPRQDGSSRAGTSDHHHQHHHHHSRRHSPTATTRLCQLPDPRAAVDAAFMNNFSDQRGIVSSMKASTAVHAPEHHSFTRPPTLPSSLSLLQSMRNEPPSHRTVAPPRPPLGVAGLLGHDATETLRPPPPPMPVSGFHSGHVSPRKNGFVPPYNNTQNNGGAAHAATAETVTRPTAAQRFLQGDAYSKPSILPQVLPPPIPTNPRSGATTRPDTLPLTQSAAGCGAFASDASRFDANTRGLNIARVAQEEKLRHYVAQEVKTAIRREKERAVVESRLADGQRAARIEEGRIESKARQRAEYQSRMASYKFTK